MKRRPVWLLWVMFGLLPLLGVSVSEGQTTSITSSGLNTQISHGAGQPNYDITGGTRPGNGTNLFHSFGDFSVGTNQVAHFLNDSGLATTNILSRVTGGHPSNIFGAIQTTGFGNANLFLMNPAGIVFGPNASLNVGGSVAFTTADYMKLADGARFKAVPYGGTDGLLSAAPVAAFGFLSSNPGTITVQGSQLTVPDGANLTLIGGDIHLTDGTLKASNGVFSLASLARRGEAILHPGSDQPELSITPHTRMGSITVTRTAAVIETDDGQSGAIVIRGGHLVLNSATLRAGTRSGNLYTSGLIDVRAAHVLLRDSQLIGNGLDSGSAIRVKAADVTLKGSQIKSDGPNAGPVTLHAERVTLEGSQIDNDGFFDGGTIDVRAAQVMLNNSKIGSTGFGVSGGPITVQAANVGLQDSQIGSFGSHQGGLIEVRAEHVSLRDSQLVSNGFNRGGRSVWRQRM